MWEPRRIAFVAVTSREEQNALDNLQELLAKDLSKVSNDDLFEGIRAAELTFDKAQEWSGRLVAEAKRREIPWSQLTEATGRPKSTLDRRTKHLP
jgi:hypothetical protein